MAKAPVPGTVKTRLVPVFSTADAAHLARALLLDQLIHLDAISTVDLYLAFSPAEAGEMMRQLAPTSFELFPQSEGDLGARMHNIFSVLFAKEYRSVVLIGADLPPVPLDYFAQAYEYLDGPQPRVVLGPSRDGGYYLVGLNRPLPPMFENMTWSHDRVFTQTVTKLADLRIEMHELPIGFDIDTPDDLEILMTRIDDPPNASMKNTFTLLRRLTKRRRQPTKPL